MSRIGRAPITIPSGVTATITADAVVAKGPKGELSVPIPVGIGAQIADGVLTVETRDLSRTAGATQGLTRALLANLIQGVHTGFTKELELVGVGYRVALQGRSLEFNLGFSHPVTFPLPDGVDARVDGQTKFALSSVDKQLLGQVAADIRALRPPEPYKGKGVRYAGEHVRRKAGKSGKA
ncbi:MAG: 50S ribosomal protein L6 [Nitrospirota bacterium]|jgi:large subunit ribosomal protein L6